MHSVPFIQFLSIRVSPFSTTSLDVKLAPNLIWVRTKVIPPKYWLWGFADHLYNFLKTETQGISAPIMPSWLGPINVLLQHEVLNEVNWTETLQLITKIKLEDYVYLNSE